MAIQNLELFSEAIRMIEAWDVAPVNDALYPKEEYGEVKITKYQCFCKTIILEKYPTVLRTIKSIRFNENT